jgi:hypothetical protein
MKGKLAALRRSFEGHGALRGVDYAKQQQTKGYTETTQQPYCSFPAALEVGGRHLELADPKETVSW